MVLKRKGFFLELDEPTTKDEPTRQVTDDIQVESKPEQDDAPTPAQSGGNASPAPEKQPAAAAAADDDKKAAAEANKKAAAAAKKKAAPRSKRRKKAAAPPVSADVADAASSDSVGVGSDAREASTLTTAEAVAAELAAAEAAKPEVKLVNFAPEALSPGNAVRPGKRRPGSNLSGFREMASELFKS